MMEPDKTEDKAATQEVRSMYYTLFQRAIKYVTDNLPRIGPFAPKSAKSASTPTTSMSEDEKSTMSEEDTSPCSGSTSSETNRSGFSPKDMEVFQKPLCLVSTDSTEGKSILKLETEVAEQISNIDCPIIVVSIVGLYRTGKSYLMNRLAGSTTGFALGDTIESETKGIWVWCKIHPEKSNTVLLLLDTEGLGDVDKGDTSHDNNIFTLATLLCNCLVYNTKGAFDQDVIGKLTYPFKEDFI